MNIYNPNIKGRKPYRTVLSVPFRMAEIVHKKCTYKLLDDYTYTDALIRTGILFRFGLNYWMFNQHIIKLENRITNNLEDSRL